MRDRAKAEAFYSGLLGLPVAARSDQLKMTFFLLGGTHHDFAVAELGKEAPGTARGAVGLSHVAFKIGDDIETLKKAKAELDAAGIQNGAAEEARPRRRRLLQAADAVEVGCQPPTTTSSQGENRRTVPPWTPTRTRNAASGSARS